jgi:hypothetical protein
MVPPSYLNALAGITHLLPTFLHARTLSNHGRLEAVA